MKTMNFSHYVNMLKIFKKKLEEKEFFALVLAYLFLVFCLAILQVFLEAIKN